MNSRAPNEQQSEIKALISKGLEQGYLTYAEINDHLPDDVVDPEQIEDIMAVLKGVGIEVQDAAPDTDTTDTTDSAAPPRASPSCPTYRPSPTRCPRPASAAW